MTALRTTCRLIAAAALAAAATSPAFAQAAPDGKVGMNYNRCDNNYDGWGVHLWKNPGIPITGVEWAKPMPPTGKNDFGVYWHIDQSEFGSSGDVNYIIHKGEGKEQGGKDMKFSSKTSREVWINSGDRKIYSSLDDAKKARAESPCP
jgi:Bacterial pullanase-associated domain